MGDVGRGTDQRARRPSDQVAAAGRYRDTDLKEERRMRSLSRRLFTALVAIAVLVGCGSTAPPAPGVPATASLKIMGGGLNQQIYLPNKLAQQLGYFKGQDLDVPLLDQ